MVYYFLCFWTLQKVYIPFEPFFHKKGKESFGSFPRIATMRKKKCRTIFTNGTADNKKKTKIKSLIPGNCHGLPWQKNCYKNP